MSELLLSNQLNNQSDTGLNSLRKRDYLFIYAPLITPFFFYKLEINLVNSICYLGFYLYAIFLVLKRSRHLSKLDVYFFLSVFLLVFQILLGNRLGFNSCLASIPFVITYKEVISRLSFRKCVTILISLYAFNTLYMAIELISQFGLFPSIVNKESSPYSVIEGLSVGTGLYMHVQSSGLVAIVAMVGSIFGIYLASTFRYKLMFVLLTLLSLILAVVNVRGTPVLSFVLALITIILIKLSKQRIFLFVIILSGLVATIMLNSEFILSLFGYKFADINTGELNEEKLSMYFDVFLNVVYLWQMSPLFGQLFGQSINTVNSLQFTGEFAFGNILYFEGLIALFLYIYFVFNQCRFSSKNLSILSKREAGIVYFNLFAVVVYFTSLLHYGNAMVIGIANLMAFHIAFNIIIIKSAQARGTSK